MSRSERAAAWGLAALLIAVQARGPAQAAAPAIVLQPVVWTLANPVFVTSAPDGSNRLFILEQAGVIKVLQPGAGTPTVFLDLRARVLVGAQQGLHGLAFHPQYASNGRFFIDYTRRSDMATVIAECRVSTSDADVADPAERVLLTIRQPLPNLNGGTLAFGPDGFLYIGVGNAGVSNDPTNTAQDLTQLSGKILRIDVDHPSDGLPYSAPPSNPFVGVTPLRDEIFAYGLRNPWRFSFDRLTGDLLAGDVGNSAREEVDLIVRGGNYGWRIREGTICTDNDLDLCSAPGFTAPLVDYPHTGGRCAVIGGYVYRGTRGSLPAGSYVFGDFCSGEIFLLRDGAMRRLLDTPLVITSFGEDQAGEIYVVDWLGAVYRIAGAVDMADAAVAAAVLPGSRSVQVGTAATAFATMIWPGPGTATGCGIAPLKLLPGIFTYQTTDPATNQLTGSPNTPVDIASGGSRTFLIAFTPSSAWPARDLLLGFACTNAPVAPLIPDLHTLVLSAANEPPPDIVAVASTAGNDGIVVIPGEGVPGALSVATTNVGAGASITVSADTGASELPVSTSICPTEPSTGACVAPPAPSVTVQVAAGATTTFTVFVMGAGVVPFDPAQHRVIVRFTDASGVTRGLTSVAVRTR